MRQGSEPGDSWPRWATLGAVPCGSPFSWGVHAGPWCLPPFPPRRTLCPGLQSPTPAQGLLQEPPPSRRPGYGELPVLRRTAGWRPGLCEVPRPPPPALRRERPCLPGRLSCELKDSGLKRPPGQLGGLLPLSPLELQKGLGGPGVMEGAQETLLLTLRAVLSPVARFASGQWREGGAQAVPAGPCRCLLLSSSSLRILFGRI